MEKQRQLFENRYADDIAAGETSWEELSVDEQAAVCERCGLIVDPETPFDEGEEIVCSDCDEVAAAE